MIVADQQKRSSISVNAVAGKAPRPGSSIGASYFITMSAGRHNSLNSNIDTSRLQTNRMSEQAAEARAQQAMLRGSYTPSHIIKNTGLEAKASFYEAMGHYRGRTVSLGQNVHNALSTSGSMMVGRAQSGFKQQDDMGSQVAGGTLAAGKAAYSGIKAVQDASPYVVGAGRGVLDAAGTAGRATVTLVKTTDVMCSGFIPMNLQSVKAVMQNQARTTGLLHTATSRTIIHSAATIKNTTVSAGRGIKTGVVTATNAAKRSYRLVRGVVNGTVMSSVVAHKVLQTAGLAGLRGIKAASAGLAGGAVKGSVWALRRGIPNAFRGAGSISSGAGGILTSSDDMMLKGLGQSLRFANYGIKTGVVAGRTTGRVIKTSVKGTVGAVKGTYRAVAFIKKKGLRAAWDRARQKVWKATVNAGKSVVSAIINLIKAAGNKVIVPLLLIAAAAAVIMSLFSAPAAAVGSIFSGLFDSDNGDGTYTETDIRAFIIDPEYGIPAMRTAYINNLYEYMQGQQESNGGTYHYVRFKTNTQDEVVEPTIAGIEGVFYTEEDLANIIQPIFNALLLQRYELSPTEEQARADLKEIFDKLFRIDEEATVEWCGQAAIDGSGTPDPVHCIRIHARGDCPNKDIGRHDSYICGSCCYEDCDGHDSGDDEYYCSGCVDKCRGYKYCDGHRVLTVTLNMDGLYQLLYDYFEQPIDTLSNITNRTEEEELELQNYKDSYEICLEYITLVAQSYGGGMTMEDLSDVVWQEGSRSGNQEMIDLALSQVGQVGGQPYWSWYGFGSRVEWCACFVSWCMYQAGDSSVKYASCNGGGVPYFKNNGGWASGGYTDLAPGDVIFFDWNGDGKAQHTGLVIGVGEDGCVYTVEGNSGDACRMKKYNLNSSVILGYGIMDW